MKIRKIFAGMAASAIALSMMAISASAADVSGNAGVEFQMNNSWNFRDWYGTETDTGKAVFPDTSVGVQGGLVFGDAEVTDASINGTGDYTVSISASGTITGVNESKGEDATKYWNPVADNTVVTREGSPWSMFGNYKPVYDASFEGKESTITKDDITDWEVDVESKKFNMLGVTTDIAVYYESDDDDVVHCYLDDTKTTEIKITNLKVDMAGTEYVADEVYFKDDLDTLGIALINTYGDSSIDAKATPPEDGTVTISFHLEVVEEKADDTSSESGDSSSNNDSSSKDDTTSKSGDTTSSSGDTTSKSGDTSSQAGDSSAADTTGTTGSTDAGASDSKSSDSKAADSSSTAAASATSSTSDSKASTTDSKASTSSTAASTTTTGGGSTAAASTTSSKAASAAASGDAAESDATENAPAGVPAGVALGFVALAGAVAVVSKKR